MAKQPYLKLEPTECVVTQVAGQIYAAYISTGQVTEGSESEWMKRSIGEAIRIARAVDDSIQADKEIG